MPQFYHIYSFLCSIRITSLTHKSIILDFLYVMVYNICGYANTASWNAFSLRFRSKCKWDRRFVCNFVFASCRCACVITNPQAPRLDTGGQIPRLGVGGKRLIAGRAERDRRFRLLSFELYLKWVHPHTASPL